MNRKEAMRQNEQESKLMDLGITPTEAERLRKISLTLSNWGEHLCNDTEEDDEGKAYRIYNIDGPGPVKRYSVPNLGAGAIRRLAAIMANYPHLWAYHQLDPRGAALYVGLVSRLDGANIESVYTRGVCVY